MNPSVSVSPQQALIDVARTIVIQGFPAYSFITVTAQTIISGARWRSEAIFLAGIDGEIDLRRDSPVGGSYDRPSAMGIVWSMICVDMDKVAYPPAGTEPIVIHLGATDGTLHAETTLVQEFLAEGVRHESVRIPAGGMTIAGELYTPSGEGPHPIAIYLNGSSGGVNQPRAALFAAHGYQCLALGVFNFDQRPKYLNDMPIEYFKHALDWIHRTLKPRNGFVAISGLSRGGEMSLLVASHYPEDVSAVVAYVASPVMHGVVSAGAPDTGRDAQAWTKDGLPLTHLWQDNRHGDWEAAYSTEPPYRQTRAFLTAVRDVDAFERAMIPIENFPGPVMLVSASDDGFWPSTAFSEMVVQRRNRHVTPRETSHYVCSGAGHHVHYPYLPTTLISKPHAMSGLLLDGGGTPAANAAGNENSYWEVLRFLDKARDEHGR